MGVEAVDIVHHLLRIVEFGIHEFHCIPQVVVAPVLPVLDDAVEGHTEFAVFLDHAYGFALALVTLATLPESIGPQWEHGNIAGQGADFRNHLVGVFTFHEVVVDTFAHRRLKCSFVVVVNKFGRRIVVPEHGIAFRRYDQGYSILYVAGLEVRFTVEGEWLTVREVAASPEKPPV